MNAHEQFNRKVITSEDLIANGMDAKRVNSDQQTNEYGKRLVQLCMSCDLILQNGRGGNDKGRGELTFCNHRGESTIDYVICDKLALYRVKEFTIHDVNSVSDHKMLSFVLSCDVSGQEIGQSKCPVSKVKAKWNENKKGEYVSNVRSAEANERINALTNRL